MRQTEELEIIIRGRGAKELEQALGKLQARGEKAAKGIQGWFAKITPTLGDVQRIAGQVAQIFREANQLAIDAAESQNMVATSYGDLTDAIKEWSDETVAGHISARFEVEQTAATFFNMTKAQGLSRAEAFEMSKQLTELSADFSSFYNLRPELAIEKVSAAITGEYEPLKRLGIVLNEATIKQQAYKDGIAETGTALTQTQKVQAAYNAMIERAGPALGDLARTADEAANNLKAIEARWKEMQVAMGQTGSTEEAAAAAGNLAGSIERMTEAIKENDSSIKAGGQTLENLSIVLDKIVGFLILGDKYVGPFVKWIAKFQSYGLAGAPSWNEIATSWGIIKEEVEETVEPAEEVAGSMQAAGAATGELAENLEGATEGTDKLASATAGLTREIEKRVTHEQALSPLLQKRLKRERELAEFVEQIATEREEAKARTEEWRLAILEAYTDAEGAFKQWLEVQYPGIQRWVGWYDWATASVSEKLRMVFDEQTRLQQAAMGINTANVGGAPSASAGDGPQSGPASGGGDYRPGASAAVLSGGGAGAAAGGGSYSTTGMASAQSLTRARMRANQALGFEKYDITLSDLPYYTGRAVAQAVSETMRRPSMQTRLSALGVG